MSWSHGRAAEHGPERLVPAADQMRVRPSAPQGARQCWRGGLTSAPLTSARGRLGLFAWALGDGVPCPSPRLASGTVSVPTCVLPEQLACPQRAFTHEKTCVPCQLCSPGPREGHRDFNLVLMNRSGILPLKYTAVSQPKMSQNYFKVFCS